MKKAGFIIVAITWSFLIYATVDFPPWGDPNSPASIHVSPRYIEKTIEETDVPNAVTSVLADYRGYDTMFETTVIFGAGVVCFFLLRIFKASPPKYILLRHKLTGLTIRFTGEKIPEEKLEEFERIDTIWVPYDLILKTVCRILIPFIQLFALYVVAHGHYSPGGGFQGGVILGASFILLAISHDMRTELSKIKEKLHALLCPLGVLIYSGTGAICVLLGLDFLNYRALSSILPLDPIKARSMGILFVEIGVAIAVMGTMIWIYNNLSSSGKYDEGL